MHGGSLIAMGDPVGPPEVARALIWRFREEADRLGLRPVFYQVRAENLPGYIDIGLTALKLGEEALVDLKTFDLASNGKEMKALFEEICQQHAESDIDIDLDTDLFTEEESYAVDVDQLYGGSNA